MADKLAAFLAIDITTTELALAVRSEAGDEDFARTGMRDRREWRGDARYPGFDLDPLPGMIADLLDALTDRGWSFARPDSDPGFVSVACRQHDLVLLDAASRPLAPAITWQCNAAEQETRELRAAGVESSVGPLAPRFVLPKLLHMLRVDPALRGAVRQVMLTGDWVAYSLTGNPSLAKSDALSNGLLEQDSRALATSAIAAAGFDPAWFPPAASTGSIVGVVRPTSGANDRWDRVKARLLNWRFAAGLGDNHASAVGCGMTDDYRRLVVSAGTSGTINLACPKDIRLPSDGGSMRFEFYDQGVFLLRMLADCGAWYSRFFQTYAGALAGQLEQLNALTLDVALPDIRRVLHDDARHFETFPPSWEHSSLGLRTANTQFSIVMELLVRVAGMAQEVQRSGRWTVDTYVLTGGLSQSRLFQQFFRAGLAVLVPGSQVKVSGRTGPLRFKTSAYGALVNAELAKLGSLDKVFADTARFPLLDCAAFDPLRSAQADYLLRAAGLEAV